jgi:hypothetical protein
MRVKAAFSTSEKGVGGSLGVVPMERAREGGEVGRRERMWWPGWVGWGKWWM